MIIGTAKDKSVVVDILAEAYDDNETINETILPSKRKERLRRLMEYAVEAALAAGKVPPGIENVVSGSTVSCITQADTGAACG